jgi:hypothetical protein
MHPDILVHFMQEFGSFLRRKKFQYIARWIELQDVLLLPKSSALLSPCLNDENIVYTVTCAADTGGPKSQLVQEFLSTFSAEAFNNWGVRVHLLKEAYCPDDLLQQMYAPALAQAKELRAKIDPYHIIRSSLSDRLEVGE